MIDFMQMMIDLGITHDDGSVDFGRIATLLYMGRSYMIKDTQRRGGNNQAVLEWLENEAEKFYMFSETH